MCVCVCVCVCECCVPWGGVGVVGSRLTQEDQQAESATGWSVGIGGGIGIGARGCCVPTAALVQRNFQAVPGWGWVLGGATAHLESRTS